MRQPAPGAVPSPADRRQTNEWWTGRRLVTRVPINTYSTHIPAGTPVTVERKFKGLEVIGDPCPHCGVRVRVRKCDVGNFHWPDAATGDTP